jgi:hypothetical protein
MTRKKKKPYYDEYRDKPRKDELPALKRQQQLTRAANVCIVLLCVCWFLQIQGLPMAWVALLIGLLQVAAIVLHFLLVRRDGFFVRGDYVVRGSDGTLAAAIRLSVTLIAGIIVLVVINVGY